MEGTHAAYSEPLTSCTVECFLVLTRYGSTVSLYGMCGLDYRGAIGGIIGRAWARTGPGTSPLHA
jgi:hypothetical protein